MIVLNIGELSPEFNFYRCWSPKQKDFLIENGCEYIYSYRNVKTGKTAWVFVEHKRLSILLDIWSKNRPNGGAPGVE